MIRVILLIYKKLIFNLYNNNMILYNKMTEFNLIVSNIVSFKRLIDTVLDDVKAGEYNIKILKQLSDTAEIFFNNMDDCDENQISKPKEFKPRIVEVDEESSDDDEPKKFPNYNFAHKFTLSSDDESTEDESDKKPKPFDEYDSKENGDTMDFIDDFESQFDRLQKFMGESDQSIKKDRKDKFISKFLNNDIDIDKYHYLKGKQQTIDVFCNSCYSY